MSNYAKKERAKYWPVSPELLAQYNDGSHTKNTGGTLVWCQNGQQHRDGDKPAVIGSNGDLFWLQNNNLHRDGDKPAWIWSNGTLQWWQNGKYHRICGPAIIWSNGKKAWCINNKNITQEVNDWLAGEEWQGTPEQIVEFQSRFHRRFT